MKGREFIGLIRNNLYIRKFQQGQLGSILLPRLRDPYHIHTIPFFRCSFYTPPPLPTFSVTALDPFTCGALPCGRVSILFTCTRWQTRIHTVVNKFRIDITRRLAIGVIVLMHSFHTCDFHNCVRSDVHQKITSTKIRGLFRTVKRW